MWHLYLDESGDLGFDFVNKKPSKYFVICILATSHSDTNRKFTYAVKKTLKRKLNKNNLKRHVNELKGSSANINVKQYCWDLIKDETFGIYSIILNKRRVYQYLWENKAKVYNYIARNVVDKLPFEHADGIVDLVVDKSKNAKGIFDFNQYIQSALEGRLDIQTRINIIHEPSEKWPGLQVADLFSHGLFRKYEKNDDEWYCIYRNKILSEELFLK